MRSLKEIGLGLAVAIAIDATIVRIVLVQATIELLGRPNWWLPGWPARLLPQVHVERPVVVTPASLAIAISSEEADAPARVRVGICAPAMSVPHRRSGGRRPL